MDGLQLVFPTPLNRSKFDQHKGLIGPPSDNVYPVSLFMGSITGSNVHRRCHNKIAKRASKLSEISENSSSHQLICGNSSGLFPDSSAVVSSSDSFTSNFKAEKSVKKSPRKKAKKKGRQSKKQSSDSGSTEAEVLPEAYGHASLTSETCGRNNISDEDMLMSNTTGPEISSSNCRLIKNDSESNEVDDRISLTEPPKSCTSCTDVMDRALATTPIIHRSAGDSDAESPHQNLSPDFATSGGKTEDMQQIQLYCYSDVYPNGSSGLQDSLVLDSVSVASNSDESTSAGVVEKQSNKTTCRICCSEPPSSNSGDENISNPSLLISVGNDDDHNEGIKHGAQNCISSDKRVKHKRVSQSSSVNKFGGGGNFHGRTGKENSHSIWQKVEKNNSNECNGDSKKVNATLSQPDSTLKKAPPVKRNSKSAGANSLSKPDEKKLLKNKVSRKSKGKMDSDSIKGSCSYSRKGSHFNRSIVNNSAKVSVQLNDVSLVSSQENTQEVLSSVSGSHSRINSPKDGLGTNKTGQVTSESVHSALDHLEDSDLSTNAMKNQNTESQDSILSIPCDHMNQSSVSEELSPIHSHLLAHEVGQTEKEVSSVECNVQNNSSGSILWKWIPIGKKNTGLTISGSDSSSQEYFEEPSHKDSTSESNAEQEEEHASGACMDQITSSNFACQDENENKKLGNQIESPLTEHKDNHVAADNIIKKCACQDALDNYSCRIAQAVNDASRLQLACEAVHLATGGPIAEFERLLLKCSPFICESSRSGSSLTCSKDHVHGVPLCRHETPDLSLGSVWKWYEKHGSYGLEVKAQEYNSKILDGGHFPFRAYFVPSLSAVQLFKDHKQCIHSSDYLCDCNVSVACEISNGSEHSYAHQHPIFSVLFPEPHDQDANTSLPKRQMLCSEVSSSKENVPGPSMNPACTDDLELLFEYFESEQPQQRQPLYEK